MTMFFLGISVVVLVTQAFSIIPKLSGSFLYIQEVVLTIDGTPNTSSGIVLNGSALYATGQTSSQANSLNLFAGNATDMGGGPFNGGDIILQGGNGNGQGNEGGHMYIMGGSGSTTGGSIYINGAIGTNPNIGAIFLANQYGNVGIGTSIAPSLLTINGDISFATGTLHLHASIPGDCNEGRLVYVNDATCQTSSHPNDVGCLAYCTLSGANAIWRAISTQ